MVHADGNPAGYRAAELARQAVEDTGRRCEVEWYRVGTDPADALAEWIGERASVREADGEARGDAERLAWLDLIEQTGGRTWSVWEACKGWTEAHDEEAREAVRAAVREALAAQAGDETVSGEVPGGVGCGDRRGGGSGERGGGTQAVRQPHGPGGCGARGRRGWYVYSKAARLQIGSG